MGSFMFLLLQKRLTASHHTLKQRASHRRTLCRCRRVAGFAESSHAQSRGMPSQGGRFSRLSIGTPFMVMRIIGTANLSGRRSCRSPNFCIVGSARRTSQDSPINVRPQLFTRHGRRRFPLDVDSKRLSAHFSIRDVSQMSGRSSAAFREFIALVLAQRQPKGFEVHSQMIFTKRCCRQHHFVTSLNGCNAV